MAGILQQSCHTRNGDIHYQAKVRTHLLIKWFLFIFIIFYIVDQYWRHQNYEGTYMDLCSKQKTKTVKQTRRCFIFYILQSSSLLLWWHLCTLLAFSQSDPWGSHLELISNQSWRSSQGCWALVGCFAFTFWSNLSQTISIGLRLGDCRGQVIWHSTYSLSF